jgi:RNA polymerase sigma factor (sigma-70 family)
VDDDDGRKIPEQYADELACFYDLHADWLAGHACLRTQRDRNLTAARELAADLVQDTFEAAALSWETLRDLAPAQQRVWLRNTLSHKDTDHFRRRRLFRRKQSELYRKYQAAEPDPEQQALYVVALKKAAKIIEGLPAWQKRIALMKWNDHMKESEIAAELGCTKQGVTAEVRRIRRKLIDGLGPYYPLAGDDGEGEAS